MTALSVLSSMATKHILADLAAEWSRGAGVRVDLVSIGGVDAARRVRAGEVFDVVVLAREAIQQLSADGFVIAASVADFACSPSAIAVRQGVGGTAPRNAQDMQALLSAAKTIGISTGPSGKAVRGLLQHWGLLSPSREVVEALPGVPVARLVAAGDADVGIQQLSELLGAPGIDILGVVPDDVLPVTVFSMGLCAKVQSRAAAEALLRALSGDTVRATLERHGMSMP